MEDTIESLEEIIYINGNKSDGLCGYIDVEGYCDEVEKLINGYKQLQQEKKELIKDLKQFQSDWDKDDYVYNSIELILSKLKESGK